MTFKSFVLIILSFVLFSLVMAACAISTDAPAKAVEMYHDALVKKEEARYLQFSCSDWELQALLQFDSFGNVKTELVDFECQSLSQEENVASVTCQGFISASYDGEIREFPLSERTFNVILEGGEWRVCGYEQN